MTSRFVAPRHVTDPALCNFYHTIEIPGYGLQQGRWDLRDGIDRYLPALSYEGASVLDIGTSNGFVCFELERRGAQVIAFDLDERLVPIDTIPFHDLVLTRAGEDRVTVLDGVKNGFWLTHRALGSSARVVYGHANDIPEDLGPVDIAFLGNILQHLRDPLGAIASAARVASRIIVTEAYWQTDIDQDTPLMFFLPAMKDDEPPEHKCRSWWQVSSAMLTRWLEVLGYRIDDRYFHDQFYAETGHRIPHYTVVATRASPA
jgi:SAM-dependent methyltransferase